MGTPRFQYKSLDADTFLRRDTRTGAVRRVPASSVPPLRLSAPAQPAPPAADPHDTSAHHDDVYAAMLDFQRRAHEAGDPESAAPYLETLAGMLDDPDEFHKAHGRAPIEAPAPGPVRMSWVAQQTRTGKIKAVGEGPDHGRVLYGEAGRRALAAQANRGGRSLKEHQIWNRAAEQRSDRAAGKILSQIHEGRGVTRERLEELAVHLPALSTEKLRNARVLLEASWGGQKPNKQKMRDALMDHVRKLVDGPDANLPGHAGRHARERDADWEQWADAGQARDRASADAAAGAWAAGQKLAPDPIPSGDEFVGKLTPLDRGAYAGRRQVFTATVPGKSTFVLKRLDRNLLGKSADKDFTSATAARNEQLVADIKRSLGLNAPAAGVVRIGGPGTKRKSPYLVTRFVDGARPLQDAVKNSTPLQETPFWHALGGKAGVDTEVMADYVTGSEDRHGRNYLLGADGKVYSIDHEDAFERNIGEDAPDAILNHSLIGFQRGLRLEDYLREKLPEGQSAAGAVREAKKNYRVDPAAVARVLSHKDAILAAVRKDNPEFAQFAERRLNALAHAYREGNVTPANLLRHELEEMDRAPAKSLIPEAVAKEAAKAQTHPKPPVPRTDPEKIRRTLEKEGAEFRARQLPEPPPGKLFDAGDERAHSEHAQTGYALAEHARRRMPGLHVDVVPHDAPLVDHLEALSAVDRHARGLGVDRANHFGDLADHVHQTLHDVERGALSPDDARDRAQEIGRGEHATENPDSTAHDLRLNGHHDAAAFYERQAHKANGLAQAAIEQRLPAPEPEEPEPATVEEVGERVRKAFARRGTAGYPGDAESLRAATSGVPAKLRGEFYTQHGLTAEHPNKRYYETLRRNATKLAAKFQGPEREDEPAAELAREALGQPSQRAGGSLIPSSLKVAGDAAAEPGERASRLGDLDTAVMDHVQDRGLVPHHPEHGGGNEWARQIDAAREIWDASRKRPADLQRLEGELDRHAARIREHLAPELRNLAASGTQVTDGSGRPIDLSAAADAYERLTPGVVAAVRDKARAEVQQAAPKVAPAPEPIAGSDDGITLDFDDEEPSAADAVLEFLRNNPRADLTAIQRAVAPGVKYDRNKPLSHPVNAALKELKGRGLVQAHGGRGEPTFSAAGAATAPVDNKNKNDRISGTGQAGPAGASNGDVAGAGGATPPERVRPGQPVGADAPPAPPAAVPGPDQAARRRPGRVPPGADGRGDGAGEPAGAGGGEPGVGPGGGAGGPVAPAAGRRGPAGGVGAGKRGGGLDGRGPAIPDPAPAERVVQEPPTPAHPTDLSAGNFRYHSTDFAAGGLKQKYSANLAAIRTLQAIKAEGRTQATPEEQAILSRFVGWGQFPALFNNHWDQQWRQEREALRGLLTPDEWEAAKKSTLNAHYTAPEVVKAHWEIAQKLGFTGGRYLETSAGVGYYLGMMPPELAAKTHATAVELDPTTAHIAKLLYPAANVQNQGFENHEAPDHFYDFVASNVPFGAYKVHDPRYNKHQANIHDYFFLKSLDKVRPGGLVMHITSTGTLDNADGDVRKELAKHADLVGAIRFPGGAHKANAGTDVVTDMVILRKRAPGEEPGDDSWTKTTTVPDPAGGAPIPVNQYFADNPHMVLGTLDRTGSMYRGDSVNVSKTDDYDARLKAAMDHIPANVFAPAKAPAKRFAPKAMPAPGEVKEGGYHVADGKVFAKESGQLVEQQVEGKTAQRIGDHVKLRDAVRAVLNDQLAGRDASASRAELNRVYDAFVKKHGPVNSVANKRAFKTDPDAPVLLALEKYDPESKTAEKTDIFRKDTIASVAPITHANTVGEGLAASLHEFGGVDVDHIAKLTGRDTAAVGRELVGSGVAYEDPGKGWAPADQYLSGNVRQKLIAARAAAAADPKYAPNVAALEKVQPEDVDHTEIEVKLGAPWVPPTDVKEFAAGLLKADPDHFAVNYLPSNGSWMADYTPRGKYIGRTDLANKVWGTGRMEFMDLLEPALNGRAVTVYDTGPDKEKTVNREETDAAMAKMQEIRDAFKEWVWQDDGRRHRLHRFYNDNFNNTVPIKYDGSHQKFPGMNPGVSLRDHQKNFVWQVVSTGKGLAAHEVGTGKTYSMIAAAMELRRLGLARKPAIACLKANVEAITHDALRLYPGAKILSTADMFDADKRKKTISQIATGDYDMVILTHDHLDLLKMRPEVVQRYIGDELKELEAAKVAAQADDPKKSNRVVKQIEKAKANLEAKLKEALDDSGKDDSVFFEETGIDHLMVDEAHKYKSLPCPTKRDRLKGVPNSRSDRATNMHMRTRWLMDHNGGRGVVFATGTPVANTMAELYNMQRYLQPEELKARNIEAFDAWASVFGDIQTGMEFSVSGEYKPVSRFAKFVNIPELMQCVRQVMDVQRADQLSNADGTAAINRPKRKDHVEVAPKSEGVAALMESLQKRAKALKGKVEKGADNMLVICTDGRKGALDLRLVNAGAADDPDSKLNRCIDNVLKLHGETPGATQMIFSDIGVNPDPKTGFHLYGEIIKKLNAGGIPSDKIADFSKLEGAKKEAAMEAMRKGEILVGIGSTDKMGTGVNVQQKLKHLHHLDVPWLPASLEQRDGRAWRQGNTHKDIGIHRYVTEGSLDQTFWQVIGNKTRFIKQVMTPGQSVGRTAAEEDTEELSPDELMAAASGDPRILEKVNLDQDVKTLEAARKRHDRDQARLRDSAAAGDRALPMHEQEARTRREDANTVAGFSEFGFEAGGRHHTDRKEAQEALAATVAATRDTYGLGTRIAEFRGLGLYKKGEKLELRSRNGHVYPTGDSLASVEAVARGVANRATEAEEALAAKRQDIARVRENIGKTFGKADELAAKQKRQKELERELAGTALPKGYTEGETVHLADGRAVKIVDGRKDGVEVEHDGKRFTVEREAFPPKGAGAVTLPGMSEPQPTQPGAPQENYAKWDALLRTSNDRAQAEQIARATGVLIRPEPKALDAGTLPDRFRAARENPALFDVLAADLADVRVSRDDLTALAALVSPALKDQAKRLPKAKQIELLRANLK